MPISRREYDAGSASPDLAIIDLLERNIGRAFTALEILAELDMQGYSFDLLRLQPLLNQLVDEEQIESKVVKVAEGQLVYYAYRRR